MRQISNSVYLRAVKNKDKWNTEVRGSISCGGGVLGLEISGLGDVRCCSQESEISNWLPLHFCISGLWGLVAINANSVKRSIWPGSEASSFRVRAVGNDFVILVFDSSAIKKHSPFKKEALYYSNAQEREPISNQITLIMQQTKT